MLQGISPQGNIKETDLAQVLMHMQEEKVTGVLRLARHEVEKSLFLKEGRIVYATSTLPEDRLGEILFRTGRITKRQFEHAVSLLQPGGKRLGAIVVEQGYLTPKDLFEGLKDQVKEIIYSLFLWEDGPYQVMAQDLPKNAIPLHLDMVDLVSEALKRVESQAG